MRCVGLPCNPSSSPQAAEGRRSIAAAPLRPSAAVVLGALALVSLGSLIAVTGVRSPAAASEPAPPPGSRTRESAAAKAERRASVGNLVGHGGPVKAVRVSVDGRSVLTGSFDYAAMLWDISGPEPRTSARLPHDGAVNAVAFLSSGQGVRLAATGADDGSVTLFRLEQGATIETHRFRGHEAKVVALAVAPDGSRIVSAGWDRTARIWLAGTPAAGPVLSNHQGPVNAVAFSGDGGRVYTGAADGVLRVFDASTGEHLRAIYKHGFGINAIERLPGSSDRDRLLVGTLNGAALILDGATGDTLQELQSHQGPVLALAAIAKPGLMATGGGDGAIRVWRLDDGALIEEYRNAYGPIWSLAFNGEGTRLYYAGLDDFVTLWQVAPRKPFEPAQGTYPRRFQVSGGLDAGAEQYARKCSVCHTLEPDGGNRAGPTLNRLFGRRAGTVPGYPYSEALRGSKIVWDETTVAQLFELGPDKLTPGSKMPLQRLTDKAQLDALVAFLKAATTGEGRPDPGADGGERKPDSPPPKGERKP